MVHKDIELVDKDYFRIPLVKPSRKIKFKGISFKNILSRWNEFRLERLKNGIYISFSKANWKTEHLQMGLSPQAFVKLSLGNNVKTICRERFCSISNKFLRHLCFILFSILFFSHRE